VDLQAACGMDNNNAIQQLREEINFILEQEDLRWKQRAKQNWYQYGDQNTPFFHSWANHRRKVNQIRVIKDVEGREWKKPNEIGLAFCQFYQELFSAGDVRRIDESLHHVEPRVTPAMNAMLLRAYNAEEVELALSQMHPLKSPGPDGFAACFYQKSWASVKTEVCAAVLDFLNNGNFDNELNITHIALIPKKKNPSILTDYRPISLCNVLYKLMAKVIANRLKKVLAIIISPSQSAFVPGRLITDNVLVAFEALHTMDRKLKGREGYMALKLDMSKAYDRVEWTYLEAVMRKLGFDVRWVQLAMTCVRTVSFSVLINGQPHGNIIPTRGLRQGDPLSPYFFILCAEGLSSLLNQAEADGRISGIPITRGGTRINHLFFADDSLLFCKATIFEWVCVQEILQLYEEASGQKLNKEKTAIFFSRNTHADTKAHIASVVGVDPSQQYEKYLGLPALVGKSRVSTFTDIKGKIWDRINGWKEKFLSQAGKEILLKAVIQAIPTYTMSVFQLPKTLCNEINAMMSRFWWGHKENDRKVAWMNWGKMGRQKEKGGMGFRDIECFNLALLAKQGWRIIQNPDSLVGRIFKEKYFRHVDFMKSNLGPNPSYAWRSIWNAIPLLKKGLIWRVGDGNSIKIWGDKWVPNPISYEVQSPIRFFDQDARVSRLIDEATKWWNIELVSDIFNREEATAICTLGICPGRQKDKLIWAGTKNGCFSVRSAYHLAKSYGEAEVGSCSNGDKEKVFWNMIWRIPVSRVVQHFLWKACNNILPTKENLYKKRITEDSLCPVCKSEIETVGHILWSCESSKDVWAECGRSIQKCHSAEEGFPDILEKLVDRLSEEEMQLAVGVARQIWLRRNSVIFGGDFLSPSALITHAKAQISEYQKAEEGRRLTHVHRARPRCVKWERPKEGFVKLNWDAAINRRSNRMGAGVIARDETGMVVAALSASRPSITDPATAEAIVAWMMADFCCKLGFRRVVLEGDSMEVVTALKRGGNCSERYGHFVDDARQLLNSLELWHVHHVGREANTVAHELAQHGATLADECIWTTDFPDFLMPLVLSDVNVS
jgi:hypothetical protein